jgi:hypothetical protein
MKKTTKSVIMSPSSITEPPLPMSREAEEEYASLKLRHRRAADALQLVRGKPSRAHHEDEEVARANLRAFERIYGLTSRSGGVSSGD